MTQPTEKLCQYSSRPTLSLSDKDFALIRDIVYRESGIRLKDSKKALVTNRLRKRLVALDMNNFDEYCNLLRRRDCLRAEIGDIIDSITTNETYFFRENKHFDVLTNVVFPAAQAKPGKSVSIWCAGCATGQEPYTVAICALEYMASGKGRLPVSIFASDISTSALEEAKTGVYSERKMKGLSQSQIKLWFDRLPDSYSAKKELRAMIRFQLLNLLSEKPARKFDVIFCRNVMIYFDPESQTRVVANLRECLNNDGMLLIGHAESLYRNSQGFEVERIENALVHKKVHETSNKPAATNIFKPAPLAARAGLGIRGTRPTIGATPTEGKR